MTTVVIISNLGQAAGVRGSARDHGAGYLTQAQRTSISFGVAGYAQPQKAAKRCANRGALSVLAARSLQARFVAFCDALGPFAALRARDHRPCLIDVADEDEAREIARSLNEDRRAMPREQRLQVVKALASERDENGVRAHSNAAIGRALGVSDVQVGKDLKAEQVRTSSDLPPARVRGLDGKTYPARRQEPEVSPMGDKPARAA
jgi:hypothetical protein